MYLCCASVFSSFVVIDQYCSVSYFLRVSAIELMLLAASIYSLFSTFIFRGGFTYPTTSMGKMKALFSTITLECYALKLRSSNFRPFLLLLLPKTGVHSFLILFQIYSNFLMLFAANKPRQSTNVSCFRSDNRRKWTTSKRMPNDPM